MSHQVKKDLQKVKITLFSRIMVKLTIPLFLLGAVFSVHLLTAQIGYLNELNKFESQFAFKGIEKALQNQIQSGGFLSNAPNLTNSLSDLLDTYHAEQIVLYDLNRHMIIAKSENVAAPWTQEDLARSNECLRNQLLGQSFYARVDAHAKRVAAYIPLAGAEENKKQVYIARVFYPLNGFRSALAASWGSLIFTYLVITAAGYLIGKGLAKSIIKPITELQSATQEIVKGHLGKHVHIHTEDEIEALAENFNKMSDALKEMKQKAEDANPLTGLPGNQGIFHELQKRLTEKQKFVLFHIDLDRFKVFNDHFGLGRGDEAIKKTADVLKNVAKESQSDDFVGHQGGDDFVYITRPARADALGQKIVKRFDTEVVPALYRQEDMAQGYTLQIDRRRLAETGEEVLVKFPLLAVSLAGVSNQKKDFADYFDCMAAAARVKKEVKKKIESSYLIEE